MAAMRFNGWAKLALRAMMVGAGGTLAAGIAAFFGLYLYFTWRLDPAIDLAALNRSPSITFTDEEGHVIASRGPAFGTYLPLDQIPAYLKGAFLSAEDRRFYAHWGIDPKGLARAMMANWSRGQMVQGGSTITQQLARSLFLSNERSLERKLEEMFIAFWLEWHFSKDKLLETYLNRIYLGGGAYGVDAAARRYFGVTARETTLAQAVMLAAMTRAPARFAPTSDLEGARTRAALVLDGMVLEGMLTQGEAFAARAVPAGPGSDIAHASFNYFADAASDALTALNLPVSQGDLVVRTTLNRDLQRTAQEILTQTLTERGDEKSAGQGAIVVMDKEGAVRALIGGRDYLDSPFNRATQARRQPGSAFKAFVYLAAFERGLDPYTIRYDEPVDIGGWRPQNFSNGYSGPVTLDEAFAKSINTVAAQLGEEVGQHNVVATAQRLGITSALEGNRSIALGTSEVTLIDLTQAYAPLAAGGMRVQAHMILDVRKSDGTVLYAYEPPPAERIVATRVVNEMNFLMADVVRHGTGKGAALGGRDVGGKTGTTQEHRDAWFIGYTADYVAGVWIGNDDNAPMDKVVGGQMPAQIFAKVMTAAHEGMPLAALPGSNSYDAPVAADYGRERWGDPYAETQREDGPMPYDYPPPRREEDLGDAIIDFLFGD
ncbi:MAG: PBP1A family penicillin-binding protein [Alphaproteobacteria bacterium]|nr:PBP1A family penicillin-binding protein [Alphaproteobacteria bacterium]